MAETDLNYFVIKIKRKEKDSEQYAMLSATNIISKNSGKVKNYSTNNLLLS